jgi:hypothetical protein
MNIPEHLKKYEWYEKHQLWLRGEGGEKAVLRGSDLRESDLRESDLRESDLRESNLRGSDLRGSNLRGSDLSESDLRESNLRESDLRWSNLRESDLRGSDLRGSDLRWSDLSGSDLSGSNLRWSDLRGSDLSGSKGFYLLTQTDHGYMVYGTWRGEWRIIAGCRDFSISEARSHWGSPKYHIQSSGSRIVALLDWLEKQPTPEES